MPSLIPRHLPPWFTESEVEEILAGAAQSSVHGSACVWFTGLSGAGKSTTARALRLRLRAHGCEVAMLDGDVVRTGLSKGLGFSRADRDENVRRIGLVAREVVHRGGVVVCAAVSPYRSTRAEVRELIGQGRFVEVYVNTPLAVCEQRDPKGLYARARRGEITAFTGIDDPYEPPLIPDLTLDGVGLTAQENAARVVDLLVVRGLVRVPMSHSAARSD